MDLNADHLTGAGLVAAAFTGAGAIVAALFKGLPALGRFLTQLRKQALLNQQQQVEDDRNSYAFIRDELKTQAKYLHDNLVTQFERIRELTAEINSLRGEHQRCLDENAALHGRVQVLETHNVGQDQTIDQLRRALPIVPAVTIVSGATLPDPIGTRTPCEATGK